MGRLWLLVSSRPPADAAAEEEHLIAPAAAEVEAEAARLPVGLLLAMIGCGSLEVP